MQKSSEFQRLTAARSRGWIELYQPQLSSMVDTGDRYLETWQLHIYDMCSRPSLMVVAWFASSHIKKVFKNSKPEPLQRFLEIFPCWKEVAFSPVCWDKYWRLPMTGCQISPSFADQGMQTRANIARFPDWRLHVYLYLHSQLYLCIWWQTRANHAGFPDWRVLVSLCDAR